jgi:hypothetical protein
LRRILLFSAGSNNWLSFQYFFALQCLNWGFVPNFKAQSARVKIRDADQRSGRRSLFRKPAFLSDLRLSLAADIFENFTKDLPSDSENLLEMKPSWVAPFFRSTWECQVEAPIQVEMLKHSHNSRCYSLRKG